MNVRRFCLLVALPLLFSLLLNVFTEKTETEPLIHKSLDELKYAVRTLDRISLLIAANGGTVPKEVTSLSSKIDILIKDLEEEKRADKKISHNDTIYEVMPFFSEFLFYAALVGVFVIGIEHQIREVILPESDNIIKNTVIPGMKNAGVIAFLRTTGELDVTSPEELLDRDYTKNKQEIIQRMSGSPEDSQQLEKAKKALEEENIDEAIQIFDELSKRNKQYYTHLLTALVSSKNPSDWHRAEKLLPEFGEPSHYSRLSYEYWTQRNFDKAILAIEKAYDIVPKQSEKKEDKIAVAKVKNNLAYYYTDAKKTDKAKDALKYANDAVEIVKEYEISDLYAKHLDTLGYVKIIFGADSSMVREGRRDCDTAEGLGADGDMYLYHVKCAQERLEQLSKLETTGAAT